MILWIWGFSEGQSIDPINFHLKSSTSLVCLILWCVKTEVHPEWVLTFENTAISSALKQLILSKVQEEEQALLSQIYCPRTHSFQKDAHQKYWEIFNNKGNIYWKNIAVILKALNFGVKKNNQENKTFKVLGLGKMEISWNLYSEEELK